MTVAEYARHRRCSRRAVYDALRAGRIARLPGGRIDAKVADRAWKVNTLGHVGGKPQPKGAVKVVGADRRRVRVRVSDRAVATGEAEARRLLGAEAGTVLSFADARRARELVKLSREALALRKMQRELVEVAAVARRSFHLWRLVRDRQDAWVSRVAPLLAAKFNVSEGDFWRALKGEVRKLQEELAGLDIAARRRWGSWPRRRRSSGASWPSCRAFRAPHLVGRRYACRSHSPARSPRSP